MNKLPPLSDAVQTAVEDAMLIRHSLKCDNYPYDCNDECNWEVERAADAAIDAAYPHIVIATLRWAAANLRGTMDARDLIFFANDFEKDYIK